MCENLNWINIWVDLCVAWWRSYADFYKHRTFCHEYVKLSISGGANAVRSFRGQKIIELGHPFLLPPFTYPLPHPPLHLRLCPFPLNPLLSSPSCVRRAPLRARCPYGWGPGISPPEMFLIPDCIMRVLARFLCDINVSLIPRFHLYFCPRFHWQKMLNHNVLETSQPHFSRKLTISTSK